MKSRIWTTIRNLNWFPAPRPLTELSIISIIELLFYVGVFVFTIWLYQQWTDVTVREIDIECESLHPRSVSKRYISMGNETFFNYTKYSFNDSLGCNIDIDIPFSKVDTIGHSYNYIWKIVKQNRRIFSSHSFQFPYFDNLLDTFRVITDTPDYLRNWDNQYFYFAVNSSFDNYIKWLYHKKIQKFYTHDKGGFCVLETRTKELNRFSCKQEFLAQARIGNYITEQESYGVMSKPRWYDKYDVSQCYFKVNIKSHTLSKIFISFRIRGANDYTFLKEKPDSLDGQHIYYCFDNEDLIYDESTGHRHDRTILFHVKSKELELLQQARIFGVTAILSALITIFMAFVIITICRSIYKHHAKSILKKQEKQSADNGNKGTANNENKKLTSQSDYSSEQVLKEMTRSHNNKNKGRNKK